MRPTILDLISIFRFETNYMPEVKFYLKRPTESQPELSNSPLEIFIGGQLVTTFNRGEQLILKQNGRSVGRLDLRLNEEKKTSALIYLQFKYNNNKLVYSFGQTIDPAFWNKAKQRVRNNKITTINGDHALNDLLDRLEEVCLSSYKEHLKDGVPDPSLIKADLHKFLGKGKEQKIEKTTFFDLTNRFISGEIKSKQGEKQQGTLNIYSVVVNHLKRFSEKYGYEIDFDTINLDFFYKYKTYLTTDDSYLKNGKQKTRKAFAPNYVAKHIQVIKLFMGEAIDLRLTTNEDWKNKKFAASWEETDSVYLRQEDLDKLIAHDFSNNKRLDQVRDLFVFGCNTGLRFSDYSRVAAPNMVEIDGGKFIRIVTKKTGDDTFIPVTKSIQRIFDKYPDTFLPRALTNQKFNQYLKEVCQEAKLNRKGDLANDLNKELWECISSHTARRTWATNAYLSKFPVVEIMKITGHKSEAVFSKYLKISKLDAAKNYATHVKNNEQKVLDMAS
jgi:integrase